MNIRSFLLSTSAILTLGAIPAISCWPGSAIAAWQDTGSPNSSPATSATAETSKLPNSGTYPCERLDPISIDLLEVYLQVALELNDTQQAALSPALRVIDDWRGALQQRCQQLNLTDAPTALREASNVMTLTQSALAALVPAFEAFYAELTPEQQRLINDQIRQHQGANP